MLIDLDLSGTFDELLAKMQGDDWQPKVAAAACQHSLEGGWCPKCGAVYNYEKQRFE